MNNAPAPQPGGEPRPTPALVPPAVKPRRRRRRMWLGLAAVVAVVLGAASYLNTVGRSKTPAGPGAAIPMVAVAAGELKETVRVNGVIAAENFASLMVPQVRGSRSDRGRSSAVGTGGSSPSVTVASNANSSNADPGSGRSTSSSSGSSGSSSRSRSGFASSYSSRSSGGDEGGSSSGGGGGGSMGMGSSRRSGGGGSDFSMVLLSLATPGSLVKKGETVAEFDRQYQMLRRDDYKDSVSQMEASIQKMKADLIVTKEIHDQKIRAAKAAWEKAEMDLKTVEVRSAMQIEKFQLAVEEAKAKYGQLVAESKLLDASQQAQIKAAEIDRDQAKIELQRAEANVEKLSLKAPMEGIVVMQTTFRGGDFGQIQQGDQVASGQRFMTIVDPSSMVLNATVNQVDAEKLRLGAKAAVKLDAYPDIEVTATVIGIGAMAKVSAFRAGWVSDIPLRLKLDRVEPRIIPDLTASANIVLKSEKEALVAPRAGVFQENGGAFVFVRAADGWIRRDVELGLSNHVMVAVRSGLRKGDIIALQRPL